MLALGGALTGFAISLFLPHHYTARARVAFARLPAVTQESYLADSDRLFAAASAATERRQSLELMLRRSPYFSRRPYLETIEVLEAHLVIQRESFAGGLTGAKIEFDDDDVDTAIEVVRAVSGE